MPALALTEPAAPLVYSFNDDAWEDLLNFIEERRVIPIIGPELLLVSTEAGRKPGEIVPRPSHLSFVGSTGIPMLAAWPAL
jgi:hypothetical protein